MSKSFFPFLGDFPFFYSTAISIDSRTFIKVSTIDFFGVLGDGRKETVYCSELDETTLSFSTTPQYLYCCAEVYYCPAPDSLPLSQASRRRAPQSRLRACIKRFMDIFLLKCPPHFQCWKGKWIAANQTLFSMEISIHQQLKIAGSLKKHPASKISTL